jgi:cobalt-zinc-cadmium efflux system outer membrane protein
VVDLAGRWRLPHVACCLALLAVPAGAGHADDPASLTLDECLALALDANPLVAASRHAHEAARARVEQARALPQPTVGYDSDLQPHPFQFAGSDESYLGISQTIEWPSRRRVRTAIAANEADQAGTDVELVRLDLTYAVTEGFYRLLLAEARLGHAQEDLHLSQSFLEQTRQKRDAGDVAEVEVLRAEVEVAQAATQVDASSGDVALARAGLNYLLARPPAAPTAVRGSLKAPPAVLDLAALQAEALARRPEIRRARAGVERERLRRRQASLLYLPDAELGVARHRIAGEVVTWDVTISVPIPLYFWQPKKGEIAEAEAAASAAQREADHARDTVQLEVEQAWRQVVIADGRIRRFETAILAQAQETYDMLAFSYREGAIGGLDLIAARRTLLQVRQAYSEALYDSRVAAAALARAVGP